MKPGLSFLNLFERKLKILVMSLHQSSLRKPVKSMKSSEIEFK